MIPVAELRPRFLARSRREKILAVLFVAALALVWAGSWWGRTKRFNAEFSSVRQEASLQRDWLDEQPRIEARFNEIVASFSGERLPTLGEVLAKLQELQSKHGLQGPIRPVAPRTEDRLTLNTINVTINNAAYEALEAFEHDVAAALPTVSLEYVQLRPAARNNPAQLNASFRLNAVEINQ